MDGGAIVAVHMPDALETLEDAALLARARDDASGAAFQAFHRRHAGPLFRFLRGLVADRALAEDLLQESFLRLHQHLDRYDPAREPRPWLFQIARNAALNALRDRRKAEPLDDERPGSGRVAAQAAAVEAAGAARAALDGLDADEKALLLQRHGLGMKLEELAASWGCTERTIRNRLHAAADALLRGLLQGRSS